MLGILTQAVSIIRTNWRIAVLVIVFGAGWTVNGWRWESRMSDMKRDYAETLERTTREANEKQEAMAKHMASVDEQHTKELNDARSEISRLSDAVAAGSASLLVNATCGAELPQAGTGSGVGHATSARLTDAAQRNYFVLRDRIAQVTAQLTACQEIVRADRK